MSLNIGKIETSFSSQKQNWDCIMLNLEVNPKILPKKLRELW